MTQLAPYAAKADTSRGREYKEALPSQRSEYQRDRDRIVHCGAFRRLEYKTQVFVNHEGDMFRTRLTHTIEVAQIARSIARALKLNEDLTEAIALAHDLGHTPFGHAGQDALNACMREHGGFEHNFQSLRVITLLEQRYADFDGLNLTFETREGVLKHCNKERAKALGALGQRFINREQPGLEAQLANAADEIAYNNHDIDDGLRAGMISVEQLRTLPIFASYYDQVTDIYGTLAPRRIIHEVIRRMVNAQVNDLIATSKAKLKDAGVDSADAVRQYGAPLIGFSEEMGALNLELKRFLRDKLYCHYRVKRMTNKAAKVISGLYEAFIADPQLLPESAYGLAEDDNHRHHKNSTPRIVADYIAGMTDRFAIKEYARIFDPRELT
ncbi:MAG: deoxyguanosinetriphosphate triphosphohydrolase [Gammaproteobacteria bacterium]|nr:MAG: deoxyguanosinetriphosphate triphosphohydrolase [Gammaproteobacteria bacterium]